MLRFIINRLIAMVLTLFAVSVVAFAIIQLPPGDYLTTYVATLNSNGDRVDPSTIEALRQQYGFGEPFLVQYWKWISGIVGSGDFGQSFEWKAPVTSLIWGRLGNSILVEGLAVIVMWTIALPIGIYAAVRKYSLGDYLATIGGFIGLAVPNFLMALVLMYLSFVWFGTTIGGLFSPEFENAHWSLPRIWDFLSRAWAPVLVLATAGTAELIRILRANLLDELKKPYVTTARAKGLPDLEIPRARGAQPLGFHHWLAVTDPGFELRHRIGRPQPAHSRSAAAALAHQPGHVFGWGHYHAARSSHRHRHAGLRPAAGLD